MKRTNEVSKLAGVSRRTLQYYDDEGMIRAERSPNNYRLYGEEALERVWQIMVYKEMGFELREIKQMMSGPETKQKDCLMQRMTAIKSQIAKLQGQMKFISLVQRYGMPTIPTEDEKITYAGSIKELRKKMEVNEYVKKSKDESMQKL